MDKEDYDSIEIGNTIIETWKTQRVTNPVWVGIYDYKLKVTINGKPQRVRTYQSEDAWASGRFGACWEARKRNK